MERKAHNSLYEAALQVQSGITPEPEINEVVTLGSATKIIDMALKKKPRKIVQSGMRAESTVIEYFENYFGDNLNEDTSDEDIMEAVYDLIDLTEAVLEAFRPNLKSKLQLHPQQIPPQIGHKKQPQIGHEKQPQRGHEKQPQRGQDPKADYRADRDKHMNTRFRSQAAQDASWANRKNWGK
jgi:hypothetical protein